MGNSYICEIRLNNMTSKIKIENMGDIRSVVDTSSDFRILAASYKTLHNSGRAPIFSTNFFMVDDKKVDSTLPFSRIYSGGLSYVSPFNWKEYDENQKLGILFRKYLTEEKDRYVILASQELREKFLEEYCGRIKKRLESEYDDVSLNAHEEGWEIAVLRNGYSGIDLYFSFPIQALPEKVRTKRRRLNEFKKEKFYEIEAKVVAANPVSNSKSLGYKDRRVFGRLEEEISEVEEIVEKRVEDYYNELEWYFGRNLPEGIKINQE